MSELHSIVVPVYNEKPGLEILFQRLKTVIDRATAAHGYEFEVILVNDGSSDGSSEGLDALVSRDKRFRVVHLSRNFGHQVALTAGLEWSRGKTVTVMDADLQDPPELIEEFFAKWRDGYQVVYAVRRSREGETKFKLFTAKMFYRLIHRLTQVNIPLDTGDFRLMDARAIEALLSLPEKHRFVRGLVSWVGFKQIGVPYDRPARQFGQTHYPFHKMLKFALDGVTAFSGFPLQMASYVGVMSSVVAFLTALYIIYIKLFTMRTIQGWSSMMVVVLFIGGLQLMALGVIGEYLARTYDETRRRPLYFVGRTTGFDVEVAPRRAPGLH